MKRVDIFYRSEIRQDFCLHIMRVNIFGRLQGLQFFSEWAEICFDEYEG